MNKTIVFNPANRLFIRFKRTENDNVSKSHTERIKKAILTPFIQKLCNVIEQNLENEDFGIMALCKAAHLSRAQLHNRIKADTGLSTSIFIRDIRLKNAKILLKNTDLNVSEVAYQVGFKSRSYFSTLFTEKYKITPKEMSQKSTPININ